MSFVLRLTFGGLCLMVQEDANTYGADPGFYVIFPNDPLHTPYFMYQGQYAVPSEPAEPWNCIKLPIGRIPILDNIKAGTGHKIPDMFAQVSSYVSKPVLHTHYTSPGADVANVVQLPKLQRAVEPYGNATQLAIMTPSIKKQWAYGLFRVEYAVDAGELQLSVAGTALPKLIPSFGIIEAAIANVPNSKILNPTIPGPAEGHEHEHEHGHGEPLAPVIVPGVGDEVQHAKHYYNFLKSGGSTTQAPPMIVLIPSLDLPVDIGCKKQFQAKWILPEECTVGSGCPESNPMC